MLLALLREAVGIFQVTPTSAVAAKTEVLVVVLATPLLLDHQGDAALSSVLLDSDRCLAVGEARDMKCMRERQEGVRQNACWHSVK